MNKLILPFMIILLSSVLISDAQTWIQKAHYGGGQRYCAASFSIDGIGYVGTGRKKKYTAKYSKDFYKYNTNTDSWSPIASLTGNASAVNGAVGLSIDGKGYICGGNYADSYLYNSTNVDDVWEYNPDDNLWYQRADLPIKIRNGVGFSIESKGYVGLGFEDEGGELGRYGETSSFYEYNPSTNSWTKLNDFPGAPRQCAVGFAYNGKAYVGLGFDFQTPNCVYYTDFWEYDPASDNWTRLSDFPGSGRQTAIGFALDGYCYMGMGAPNDFYRYNLDSQEWEFLNYLPTSEREYGFSFCVNNSMFYGGGKSTLSILSDFWGYSIVEQEPLEATFTSNKTSGAAPLTIDFTDNSAGDISSWSWDFGDGTTSTEQNPSNTYTSAGTYTVSLTVTGSEGTDTESKTGLITVSEQISAPTASFISDTTSGNIPLDVVFIDNSTGNISSWKWNFGDGSTSTDRDAIHTYTAAGSYTVSLTVTGAGGTDTETKTDLIVVTENVTGPIAGFTCDKNEGVSPLTVTFTDTSNNDVATWLWDFGDGNMSSNQNPSYTYSTPGTYSVSLTVTGRGGTDSVTKTDLITVSETIPSPIAGFTCDKTNGMAPLTVSFTDTSKNEVATWLWDFGDGNMSSGQNPVYTYSSAGTYTVSLIVEGAGGTDTIVMNDLIKATTQVGIGNIRCAESIQIYPNPSYGTFSINLANPSNEIITICIYNVTGELIYSKSESNSDKIKVELPNQVSGIYYLKVNTEYKEHIRKIMLK